MNTPTASQNENLTHVSMPRGSPTNGAERELTISNTNIHIKSVFTGQTSFDDALRKIITRKVANTKN